MTTTARFIINTQDKMEEEAKNLSEKTQNVTSDIGIKSDKAVKELQDGWNKGMGVIEAGADDTVQFWANTGSSCINYFRK